MKRVNKTWMAALAATLLVGMLVGVVWARPSDRSVAADITRKVTLTGADFIPSGPYDWKNDGGTIYCVTGSCSFTAPVVFPCLPAVTVERVKLHVDDKNAVSEAYADLYRTNPTRGIDKFLVEVMSPSGTSDGLKTYSSGLLNEVVWPSQKAYVRLDIDAPNIDVYGVTVEYHRNI